MSDTSLSFNYGIETHFCTQFFFLHLVMLLFCFFFIVHVSVFVHFVRMEIIIIISDFSAQWSECYYVYLICQYRSQVKSLIMEIECTVLWFTKVFIHMLYFVLFCKLMPALTLLAGYQKWHHPACKTVPKLLRDNNARKPWKWMLNTVHFLNVIW